jgi:integrase
MAKHRRPELGSIYRRKKRLPDGSQVVLSHWWIKYSKGGRIIRETSKSEKWGDAQKLLTKRLAEIETGTFLGRRIEKVLIDELLDDVLLDYRTNGKAVRFAQNCVNHLRRFFGGRRAASIGTSDAQRYAEYRRSSSQGMRPYRGRKKTVSEIPIKPVSNSTINRELALLKRAFYLGFRNSPRKVASVPHIPLMKENNVREGFFEHNQFLAVRDALPEDLRPVFIFAYYTGCRLGEIQGLRWEQVDLRERVVRLEPGTTKNDEARILPLTSDLFHVLSMQRSIRDAKFPNCPWVFFRSDGQPVRRFRRSWKTACKAAGLVTGEGVPSKLFHDLRRTGVRNLVRSGVPETVAMKISGHKTRSIFDRYNITSERDLHDAARKLEAYMKRKTRELGHTLGTHKEVQAVPVENTAPKLLQ